MYTLCYIVTKPSGGCVQDIERELSEIDQAVELNSRTLDRVAEWEARELAAAEQAKLDQEYRELAHERRAQQAAAAKQTQVDEEYRELASKLMEYIKAG